MTAGLRSLLAIALLCVPSSAAAQPTTRARCRPRADLPVPDELTTATFVRAGREIVALPGFGRRLYRASGCAPRFAPVPAPMELSDARAIAVGDALVITTPGGSAVYRRGRARALATSIPPSAATAAYGDELLFVARDEPRAGIVDARSARVLELPASDLRPGRAPLLALDEHRAFVLGEVAHVLDRSAGTWASVAAPPRLDEPALLATPSGAVLIGTERSGSALVAHAYDASSGAWTPLPLPNAPHGRVEATWRHDGRVVVQTVSDAMHTAWILDPSALTWRAVDGAASGGMPTTSGGFVLLGARDPQLGLSAAAVDPVAARWRHASMPAMEQDVVRVLGEGYLAMVRLPRERPGGWVSRGCEGPRPPGAPGCDPVMVPTRALHDPGAIAIIPLAWQ